MSDPSPQNVDPVRLNPAREDPLRIDIVSDVVCPWCIVGFKQIERAVAETGLSAELHWHPFELNPDMPAEGQNLGEHIAAKYGSTPEQSRRARERLTALGADLGFTFNYSDDMRMVNTFRAHQLIHWANGQGRGHQMKLALFSAHFTARRDVNDPDVLAGIAAEVGLDADEARAVLADGRFADVVRQEEAFWTGNGITGVPAVIVERKYLVSGAQGEERFAAILRHVAEERAGSA